MTLNQMRSHRLCNSDLYVFLKGFGVFTMYVRINDDGKSIEALA